MTAWFMLYAVGVWSLFVMPWQLTRLLLFTTKVGSYDGHIILTLTALFVISRATYGFLNSLRGDFVKSGLVLVGVTWSVLTIGFEYVLGHLVMGVPLDILLTDYDILSGRIWSLLPITVLASPYIVGSKLIH